MRCLTLVIAAALSISACTSSGTPRKPQEASAKSTSRKQNTLYSLTLMRQGSQFLQQGRFDAALQKFEEANELAPGNATTFNMIGLCHLRLGEYDRALAAFTKSINLVPAFTDAVNNRGATYLAMGQYRMAEVDFTTVLTDSTYPHRWNTFYNLGMTYLQQGLAGPAEENFRNAVKGQQPVYEAYLRLAKLAQDRGANDEAVTWLEEATFTYPTEPEAALQLGRLLVLLGRRDEATPYLQRVVDSHPGSDMADEANALLEGS